MDVELYTMEFCPRCDDVKQYLNQNSISYSSKDLEDPDVTVELLYEGIVPTEAPLMRVKDKIYQTADLFLNGKVNLALLSNIIQGDATNAGY